MVRKLPINCKSLSRTIKLTQTPVEGIFYSKIQIITYIQIYINLGEKCLCCDVCMKLCECGMCEDEHHSFVLI